jgi:hypothetical protein
LPERQKRDEIEAMAASSSQATPFNEGVFFASQDCASLSTRIYADIIDFVVIWLAWIIGVALAAVTGQVYYGAAKK